MSKRTACHANKGFTLLEVLVALIFFSLIGLVMQQVTAATVSSYQNVRLKLFASWIAENKMAQIRLSTTFPKPDEHKEELVYGSHEWELVTRIKTTDFPDVNQIEMDVFYIEPAGSVKNKVLSLTGAVGRY